MEVFWGGVGLLDQRHGDIGGIAIAIEIVIAIENRAIGELGA